MAAKADKLMLASITSDSGDRASAVNKVGLL